MLDSQLIRVTNEMIRTFYNFGLKIGTILKDRINVGFCDDIASVNAAKYFIKGLTSAGIHVHNNGVITLPHFLYNTKKNGYHSIYICYQSTLHDSLFCFDSSNTRIPDLTIFEQSQGKKVSDYIGFQVMQRDCGHFLTRYDALLRQFPKTLWTSSSTIVNHTVYKIFHKYNWEFVPYEGRQKIISRVLQTPSTAGVIFDAIGQKIHFVDTAGRLVDSDLIAIILMHILQPNQVYLDSHACKPIHAYCEENTIEKCGYVDDPWEAKQVDFMYKNNTYVVYGEIDAFQVCCHILPVLYDEILLKEFYTKHKAYKWQSNIEKLKTIPKDLTSLSRTQHTQHFYDDDCGITVTGDCITAEADNWESLNALRQRVF